MQIQTSSNDTKQCNFTFQVRVYFLIQINNGGIINEVYDKKILTAQYDIQMIGCFSLMIRLYSTNIFLRL